MLSDFYSAFAPVSFTVFGLWLVVVQTRHAEWSKSPEHRRRAYAVSLHFALPGFMSLLSLVDPTSKPLWRWCFSVSGIVGAAALVALHRRVPIRRPSIATEIGHWVAVTLYLVLAAVAIRPGLIADLGIDAPALRVEAFILSLLVFLGMNVAWLLMFDEVEPAEMSPASGHSH